MYIKSKSDSNKRCVQNMYLSVKSDSNKRYVQNTNTRTISDANIMFMPKINKKEQNQAVRTAYVKYIQRNRIRQ